MNKHEKISIGYVVACEDGFLTKAHDYRYNEYHNHTKDPACIWFFDSKERAQKEADVINALWSNYTYKVREAKI